jgi:hypothetical protein
MDVSTLSKELKLEVEKLMLKARMQYEDDKIEFTGLLMETLGPIMKAAIRADESFSKWYAGNDFLSMWRFLKNFYIKGVMLDVDEIKYELWHSNQGNKSFDEYILGLEHKLQVLKVNKEEVTEKDLFLIFLKGLNVKTYSECITRMGETKGTELYPSTYVDAKERVKVWGRLRGVDSSRNFEGVSKEYSVYVTKASGKVVKCYRCGDSHLIKDCPLTDERLRCDKCDQRGHVTEMCALQKFRFKDNRKTTNYGLACMVHEDDVVF